MVYGNLTIPMFQTWEVIVNNKGLPLSVPCYVLAETWLKGADASDFVNFMLSQAGTCSVRIYNVARRAYNKARQLTREHWRLSQTVDLDATS
jgi:hypothetical protein